MSSEATCWYLVVIASVRLRSLSVIPRPPMRADPSNSDQRNVQQRRTLAALSQMRPRTRRIRKMTTIVTIIPIIPVGPRISSRSFPRESQRSAAARSGFRRVRSVVATQHSIRLGEMGQPASRSHPRSSRTSRVRHARADLVTRLGPDWRGKVSLPLRAEQNGLLTLREIADVGGFR